MAAKNSPNPATQADALAALQQLLDATGGAGDPPTTAPPSPAANAAEDALAALAKAGRPLVAPTGSALSPEPTLPLSSSPPSTLPMPQVKPVAVEGPGALTGVGSGGAGWSNALGKSPMKTSAEPAADGLSASGFVSMLAKPPLGTGGGGAKDELGELMNTRINPPSLPAPARPQPVAHGDAVRTGSGVGAGSSGGAGGGGGGKPKVKVERIREAREIAMTPIAPAPMHSGTAGGGRVGVPSWYHTVLPIMFTMASLLALIGMWAILGSIARVAKIENMPTVPPLNTTLVEGDYVPVTNDVNYYMPFIMLLAVPVALCLMGMALYMKRRIRLAGRAGH